MFRAKATDAAEIVTEDSECRGLSGEEGIEWEANSTN